MPYFCSIQERRRLLSILQTTDFIRDIIIKENLHNCESVIQFVHRNLSRWFKQKKSKLTKKKKKTPKYFSESLQYTNPLMPVEFY